MKKLIFPIVFGLMGTLVLIGLSYWQVQRLAQKEAMIAAIEQRVAEADAPIPLQPTAADDRYMPIVASGITFEPALHVLTSMQGKGPGYREVVAFELDDGRRVLLDRGFIAQSDKDKALSFGPMTVTGNLDWPRESDGFTPEPDLAANIWFARDVDAMAKQLKTEPVLLVARNVRASPVPLAVPVTVKLPNNHLQYAITWGLMAAVWLAMSVYLIIRIRRKTA